MPTFPRNQIVSADTASTYHVIARCVRQSFLCGYDHQSQKDYSHRKKWISKRLEWLAGIFLIDIGSFAIMSNHLHLLIRIRPDLAFDLSDDEVVERWWQLGPKKIKEENKGLIPEEVRRAWIADEGFMIERRRRLGSISWFMKYLSEYIAKRANREDGVSGHFWDGRFKSQRVLDEEGVLNVSAYIDLNPYRAGISRNLEESDYTSIQQRILARRCQSSPIFLARYCEATQALAKESPFLCISERDYIDMLSWYVSRGQNLPDIPEPIEAQKWITDGFSFIQKASVAIGSKAALAIHAQKLGRQWLKGSGMAWSH